MVLAFNLKSESFCKPLSLTIKMLHVMAIKKRHGALVDIVKETFPGELRTKHERRKIPNLFIQVSVHRAE